MLSPYPSVVESDRYYSGTTCGSEMNLSRQFPLIEVKTCLRQSRKFDRSSFTVATKVNDVCEGWFEFMIGWFEVVLLELAICSSNTMKENRDMLFGLTKNFRENITMIFQKIQLIICLQVITWIYTITYTWE